MRNARPTSRIERALDKGRKELTAAINDLRKAQEKASDSANGYARRLACATWVLAFATVVLALATVVQFVLWRK